MLMGSDLTDLAAFVLQAAQMQQLCVQSNCAFWVDMELFRADMTSGLLPKTFPGVAQDLVSFVFDHIDLQVGCLKQSE